MRALPQTVPVVPTLEEVAKLAGVSRATASRVFTASPRVSPRARRAVERAAQQLSYVPNRAARTLVTGRTDSVGLVIPEPTAFLFGDPFFPRLVRGISEVLSQKQLQLVLLAPQSAADESRLEGYLTAGHVDGVLMVSLHGRDPLPERLQRRGMPVVLGGRPAASARITYVDVDNVGGARMAVEHLLATGRKRIATITGPLDMGAGIDRLRGYREAIREAGLQLDESYEHAGDFGQESGVIAMQELLGRHPDLDAVFCASDVMAAGALATLREKGRRVPQDIAIVGFDDTSIAMSTTPALSSVRQPIEEMGREMASLLLSAIDAVGPGGKQVILATELVVRSSSGQGGRE
ncbi:MAG TPA: LacI family DNA-binding transcriptional regulator [Candidatus Dormibacteraeota bacterium]|nr:LacI family DNA-binding transcriptional regulator [Candidatus Dormibacteraeota bacterium]